MKPAKFTYARPSSVDEALSLLALGGEDAKLLAGGQSLVPLLNLRMAQVSSLIDLNRLTELTFIRRENGMLCVGALTRHRQIEVSDEARTAHPLVPRAAAEVGHLAIRNRGTIGGSLAHADPAADYPALVLALNAELTVEGNAGSRAVAADDFFQGLFQTALEPGELLTKVSFPITGSGSGAAYEKFPNPASRFAVVGVAAMVTVDGGGNCTAARIGITGAADTPFRATDVENHNPWTARNHP